MMNDLEYMLHIIEQFERIENLGLETDSVKIRKLWELEYAFYEAQLDRAEFRILGLSVPEREQLTLADVRDLTMQRLTEKGKTPVANDVLRETYKDFLLKWHDAEYPMRRVWEDVRKTDVMLQVSWFQPISETLLVKELVKNWAVINALTDVIKYATWNNLQSHPFVQECFRIHQIFFKELIDA